MTTTSKFVRTAAVAALVLGIGATAAAAGGFERYERDGSIKDAPVASEGRKLEFSVNGGFMSDYVFRGFSQNDEEPSWFVGADATYGIFYTGVWAALVDPSFTASDAEVDLYAGIKPKLGPVEFDFGVIYYGYVGEDKVLSGGVDADYWEFKAGASAEILPKLTASATYYYSPDYTFETGPSHVIEGGLGYALPKVWVFDPTVDGTIGYLYGEDEALLADYTYWNVGLALAVDKLTLDFRYWDTDVDNDGLGSTGNNLADERFVFTATVALP